jgi:hypothetical protein
MDALAREIEEGGPREDVPASEMLLLHDPESGSALAVVFFDSEEDYARGDATLNAMPAGDTPGRRSSVAKYTVALRMRP